MFLSLCVSLAVVQVETIPIVFPMLGNVTWTDTFGASRGGGTRKHIGQDLAAEKMRPLLACFDGVLRRYSILSTDGYTANYIHINNDTPGTDDGEGGDEYAYAPGVWDGVSVVAGQMIAYCGDSGNAEETIPHLHFELFSKNGVFNAANSLLAAVKVDVPVHPVEHREFLPVDKKQIRWDLEVRSWDPTRNEITADLAGTVDDLGVSRGVQRLTRVCLKIGALNITPKAGDYIGAIGPVSKPSEAIVPTSVLIFRNRYKPLR
jgi:hypothetical protein